MHTIALSGNRIGASTSTRKIRTFLLNELVSNGCEISNSYGDQIISLGNIEENIQAADAFIFMPDAQIEDIFYAVSILTGIGFTMSLFVGNLAFVNNMEYMDGVKIGVLVGSLLSTLAGYFLLLTSPKHASK